MSIIQATHMLNTEDWCSTRHCQQLDLSRGHMTTWRCEFCRTIATCKVPKFVFYLFHRDMTRYLVSPDVIEMGWKNPGHNWLTTAERKQQLQESSRKNNRNDTTNFHQLHLHCWFLLLVLLGENSLTASAFAPVQWFGWNGLLTVVERGNHAHTTYAFALYSTYHVCIKKEIWSMLYRVCQDRNWSVMRVAGSSSSSY